MMNYAARQKKLASKLRGAGVEALLVTHLPNIRYLCGFTGSAGVLLFDASGRNPKLAFYTDGRYTQQAHEEVRGAKVVITRQPAMAEACATAQKAGINVVGFEAEHLSYAGYKQLGQLVRGKIKLTPVASLIEQLRMTKDADEIGQIRASVLLAASLFQTALSVIRPGAS